VGENGEDGGAARRISYPLRQLRIQLSGDDGKRVYAFFGSRGVYCYDLDGKLIWEKDFDIKMTMRLGFGEGTAPC